MSDALAHYGVLGMKWGVRKDRKPQGWQSDGSGRKSAYSAKQQRRDERIYGKWAARRIRKRVDRDNESVQSARNPEVRRLKKKQAVVKTVKKIVTSPKFRIGVAGLIGLAVAREYMSYEVPNVSYEVPKGYH